MEEVHHQYSGGYAVWTCHIINTEEGVQYMDTDTAQGVVSGCIYLENDILQTISPRFHPTVMNQDVLRFFQDANMITFGSLDNSSVIL